MAKAKVKLSPYEEYIAEMQKASADCWKCFTVSRENRKSSSSIFASVRLKYKNKNSPAYQYVNRYVMILSSLLSVEEKYVKKMAEASGIIWRMFKAKSKDIYDDENGVTDSDDYWIGTINDFAGISNREWDGSVDDYVNRYACVCLDEIDRSYRRKHEVRESKFWSVYS